jgi:hypothetical protein
LFFLFATEPNSLAVPAFEPKLDVGIKKW